ncbi:MAG TPA: hypothetical protein VJ975_09055 [Candidatus Limnocylindria bacterium]|nr:hypothetical protein [Candidatus Limnocylindria bacterium]
MHRWWSASRAAAGVVADRPALWLPGALAWVAGVGWLALIIGVARPPTTAGLTFLGAGIFASGAWPWNAVALGLGALLATLVALLLGAVAEAALLRGRRTNDRDVRGLFVLGVLCAAPVVAGLLLTAMAAVMVARTEFNAPRETVDPVARTALRVAPLLVVTVVAAAAGAAVHAAAARHLVGRTPLDESLKRGVRDLRLAGAAALTQASVLLLVRIAFLAVAAALLRVLWAPIGQRVELAGIDPPVALLLVGFVAIWLCLVLGGGALHAWGSVSWTGVLGTRIGGEGRSPEGMETSTGT